MRLAIDTSGPTGQLYLQKTPPDSSGKTFTSVWEKKKSHSEVITVEFEKLARESATQISDIEELFVVTGPGSFTGLRVGINFAKSLAYSLKIKICPLNTLWAMAVSANKEDGQILSLFDAQRNSVFASLFSVNKKTLQPVFENRVIAIEDLTDLISKDVEICGPGWQRYRDEIKNSQDWLHKSNSIDFPFIFSHPPITQALASFSWEKISPLYIRQSAAEEKKNQSKASTD